MYGGEKNMVVCAVLMVVVVAVVLVVVVAIKESGRGHLVFILPGAAAAAFRGNPA